MDGWHRNDPPPDRGPALSSTSLPAAAPTADAEETVFTLLAARARGHSTSHLVLTAVIGIVDAAAIGWAHPGFWAGALLFAAAGAYGLWGLLDRAVTFRVETGVAGGPATEGLRVARELVALLGMLAVIAAVGGLFGTTFEGWIS